MYDNLTRTELEFAYREAEKRIAELEDERSDLDMIAKNYAIKIANLKKSCDETQELLDKQIEATYKLDKENAELKDDNKVMADNYSKMEQKFYDNLTKAKEIIKTFLGLAEAFGYSPSMDKFITEAKQFISEVEK